MRIQLAFALIVILVAVSAVNAQQANKPQNESDPVLATSDEGSTCQASPLRRVVCWPINLVRTVFSHMAADYRVNNSWPDPYLPADRIAVKAPFELMIQKGWERQNTLSEHHFDESGTQLNEAGKLKVYWILTHTPARHREVFVLRDQRPEITDARVAAVEKYIAEASPGAEVPVSVTDTAPIGWPASRVDMIDRKWMESMPTPQLPEAEESTMSGTN